MSGSGNINPLAVYDPPLYAKQQALSRKQALAAALLGTQPSQGAYGGLASAGKNILGAFLAKSTDKDMANLYGGGGNSAPQQQQPAPSPQITNSAGSGIVSQPLPPVPGAPAAVGGYNPSPQALASALSGSAASGDAQQPQGGATAPASGGAPSPQALGAALGGAPQPQQQSGDRPADYGSLNPDMQGLYDKIPHVPGISASQTVNGFFGNNTAYMTAAYAAAQPTPEMKNAAAAYGYDSPQYRGALTAEITKNGTIQNSRGVANIPDGQGGYRQQYAPPPAPAGYQYMTGQNGQPVLVQTQNGQQAVAGSNYAAKVPAAILTPATGYDSNNQPVATNQLNLSGNGAAAAQLGIGPQVPQPPLGPQAPTPGPQGAQPPAPSLRMQNPAAAIGGIIGAPVQISSADRSPAKNAAVGGVPNSAHLAPGNAYDFVPQGISTREAATRLAQSGLPFDQIIDEGTHVHVSFAPGARGQVLARQQQQAQPGAAPPASGGAPLRPELPAGAATFANTMAGNTASEWKTTHDMASDVPTRLNVLQNILNLSKMTQTGTPEWLQEAREVSAGLKEATGVDIDPTNQAALMGEMQKYMGQYAARMAQGQGGSGSDKQFDAVTHANPNDEMFPATLQRVVPWIMANEKGIAAKANFLDAQPNAQNDQHAQIAAQNAWRNLYSPRIAQFEMMSPQQQAGYVNDRRAFKSPADRQQFIVSALKLHPYFQGQP